MPDLTAHRARRHPDVHVRAPGRPDRAAATRLGLVLACLLLGRHTAWALGGSWGRSLCGYGGVTAAEAADGCVAHPAAAAGWATGWATGWVGVACWTAVTVHRVRADGRHAHLHGDLTDRQVFVQTSLREPALSAASHAGMVNNLNDGLAWGLFPVLFATAGLTVTRIGVLAALYPAVWGIGQLVTGAWSDRVGRKPLIVAGMLLQAAALALVAWADTFVIWAVAAVLLGAGTALVYPTLLAAVGDVAHPDRKSVV